MPLRKTKFILDVNLGKLARKLRLLGFDSLYSNTYDDKDIIETALAEKRIILTRDIGILKNKRITHGYWLRSVYSDMQTKEIVKKFDLYSAIHPFQICMNCNGKIEHIAKEAVIEQLLPNTRKAFNTFFICHNCGKIYWQGSHYQRMKIFIQKIRNDTLD